MSQPNYYELWFEEIPHGLYAHTVDLRGISESRLAAATAIDDWPMDVTLRVKGNQPQDYLLSCVYGCITVSKRAQEALVRCAVPGLQFLPVRVVHNSGVEVRGYAILNILRKIAALDNQHTLWFQPRPTAAPYPRKIALRKDPIRGIDVFRLEEMPDRVYVSHRVRECLEEAGTTVGFDFKPILAY